MPKLEDRNMIKQNVCPNCKHCYVGELSDPTGFWYFCMLGVSPEDREYVIDEICERGGFIDDYGDKSFTLKLLQIMNVEESGSFTDSPREVGEWSCCQFFEDESNHWVFG